jgi:hypothetical protein
MIMYTIIIFIILCKSFHYYIIYIHLNHFTKNISYTSHYNNLKIDPDF